MLNVTKPQTHYAKSIYTRMRVRSNFVRYIRPATSIYPIIWELARTHKNITFCIIPPKIHVAFFKQLYAEHPLDNLQIDNIAGVDWVVTVRPDSVNFNCL